MVKEQEYLSDAELKERMQALKGRLKINFDKQRKLLKDHLDDKISEELLSDECIDLRAEEQQIKKNMAKLDMQMIEKERSEEYQALLKRVIHDFDRTKTKIDIVSKKEFLRLIFKRIVVKDKKILEAQLNQPFHNYYEEMKCSKKHNDSLTPSRRRRKGKSYILRPTVAR